MVRGGSRRLANFASAAVTWYSPMTGFQSSAKFQAQAEGTEGAQDLQRKMLRMRVNTDIGCLRARYDA
jgi:hypothetical protein